MLFDELADPETGSTPAHCLTVFIPLIDLSREHGPTEYWPGTHNGAAKPPAGEEPTRFCVAAGAAIIHDYRLLHRGGPNNTVRASPSAACRPLALPALPPPPPTQLPTHPTPPLAPARRLSSGLCSTSHMRAAGSATRPTTPL